MFLYGIAIADPASLNMKFNSKRSGDAYNIERKQPGKPLAAYTSEQSKFRRFPKSMPSVTGIRTTNVSTVPVYPNENLSELDLWRSRRENLMGNVEKPMLEADKNLKSTGNNGGAFFDPMGIYPVPTFKKTIRQTMRTIRDVSSKISKPYSYAEKNSNFVYNSIYNDGDRNYQDRYYKNNPRKDASGRVHLFERQFTRNFA